MLADGGPHSTPFTAYGVCICLVVLELSVGGLEVAVVNLASTLAKRGLKVRLVVLEVNEHTLDDDIGATVEVLDLTRLSRPKRLHALRRATRDAFVHVHFWGGHIRPLYRLTMSGRPTVVSYHNVFFRSRSKDLLDWLVQTQTNVIVSSSKFVDGYARSMLGGPVSRYKVIHCPSVLAPTADEPLPHVVGSTWELVLVARLVEQKDVFTALEGFTVALGRGLNARLTVIGEGAQLSPLLSRTRELGISDAVRWLGEIPSKRELGARLRQAHLKIYTSLWDSFPLVLLEAMAMGVPVVATDIPANREALGDAGVFVPVKAPVALADRIIEVLGDPAHLLELRNAGLKRVAALTPDRFADEHLELYQAM
ncbi:MAG: glycosyltransferase family 4 protein [Pseudonocardiaceae bacterium]